MKRKLSGKQGIILCALLLGMLAACMGGTARADEAEDMTAACRIRGSSKAYRSDKMTDGQYTSYWESEKEKNPEVTIISDKPIHGLYLCFRTMPRSYEIQWEKTIEIWEPVFVEYTTPEDGTTPAPGEENGEQEESATGEYIMQVRYETEWETICTGDTRFYHVFYELDGYQKIRIRATDDKRTTIGFNELFVFGEGEIPDWVQRWEPTPEKAEILFLSTHPDDEILFLGGAIAWYGVELKRPVTVAYLTASNTTRRSEALNGLWTLGIRTYPIFGEFRDCYSSSGKMADAYKDTGGKKKIQGWVTELYRRLKPDVVVTHGPDGEYGHPQHMMVADAAIAAYSLAADPDEYPESAGKYGTWQVKKLYLHLFGDEAEQTKFNWDIPLDSLGGKTANEKAEEAFAQHVTQKGQGKKFEGVRVYFSVAEYGVKRYPNTAFGLYATQVGPDTGHDDLLENIDGIGDAR